MTTSSDQTRPTRSTSRILWIFRILAARLRFVVVFAFAFMIVGGWETIRAYWGRMTRISAPESVVSSDTEYFCPMDPGVISDWPSKCPVCNMTLVRRKRGEPVPLPAGVMARMQFSPYRLSLGGIQTETVGYAPLNKVIELPGRVSGLSKDAAVISAEAFTHEMSWLESGQFVEILPIDVENPLSVSGKIQDLRGESKSGDAERFTLKIERAGEALKEGDPVRLRISCPIDRTEPFRSQSTVPPPLKPGEPRRLFVCMEHSNVARESEGPCPLDKITLIPRTLRDDQRIRWWCPMHSGVTADRPGTVCDACGGMKLIPRIVSYRPPGRVLTVPSSAAIQEGSKSVVYVGRGGGMFEARAVTLGPRCGSAYPVVSGLEPGDRVVTQGAMLLDAEARLDPNLAAGYFGASGRESASESSPPRADDPRGNEWLKEFTKADGARAMRQKLCPVTGKPLGSMGVPLKLTVRGRAVFLCCDGCSAALESNPEKYLAKIPDQALEKHP